MTQNINLNIVGTANFSPVFAEITKLKTAMTSLQNQQIGKGFNTQLSSQLKSYEQDFLKAAESTKRFQVEQVKLADATDHLTTKLSRGQFSLGEYYSMFKRSRTGVVQELEQIAQAQAKVARSFVIPSQKGGYAQVITDMSGVADKVKTAEIYQKALNTAMMDGTTKLINFGKNTQWAGRQLTVGLTVPLMAAGGAMASMFYQVDQNLRKMQAVYGVGGKAGGAFSSILPSQQEIASIRSQVVQLSQEMARTYGQTAQETAGVAADLAAAGYTGNSLLGLTKTVTKAMVLGESDRQTAMKATIALQSAYKLSTDETATALNFFSAAQAATSTTMRDLIDAIPRVGPVVRNLGGSYKDTVAMLVAMKEGGVAAGEGANALKNSLGRLISPTKTAVDSLKVFGVDILGIVNKNSGNVVGMIEALQQALSKLTPLARQQAITDIFGKFQMSRMTALLDNFNQSGTQSAKVMQMMGLSAKQLSDIAANQTKTLQESTSGQFKIAIETLKADLMPIGETFLQVATVLVKAVDFIVKGFDKLGPIKYVLGGILGGAAVLGPVIMFTGLMANLVGQVFKLVALFKMFRGGFAEGGGWTSPIKSLTNAFAGLSNYFQEVDKAMVASEALSKDLNATMMKQEESLNILTAALTRYTNAVARAAEINGVSGGGIVPPPNRPSGGPVGPGGMPFAPTGGPTSPIGIIGNATRPTPPVLNTMSVNKSGAGEDVGRTGFVYETPSGNKIKGNEFIHLVTDKATQNVLGNLAVVPGYFDVPNSPGVALNRNLKENPMPIVPPSMMQDEEIVKRVLRDLKLSTAAWSVEAHAPAMSLENITSSESSKIAMLRAMQQLGPSVLPQLTALHQNGATGEDVHNFFANAMGPEQWQAMRKQAVQDVLAAYEAAQKSVHEQLLSSGRGAQIGTTAGLQSVTSQFGSELLKEYKVIIDNMDQQIVTALSVESEKTGQGLSTAIREGMRRNSVPALINLGATAATHGDLVVKEFENLIKVAQQAMAKIASQVGSTAVEISAMAGVGTAPVISQAAARVSRVEQIAKGGLGAVRLATGGKVQGPGGPKDDVIPAMLSDGEYVVNANAVGHYGTGFLDAVNSKKLAGGGPAGSRLAGIMDSLFGRERMQSSSQIEKYLRSSRSAYTGHNIEDFFASRKGADNIDMRHVEDLIASHKLAGTAEEQQLITALEQHASGDWGNKSPLAQLSPEIVNAGRASLDQRLSQMPGDTVRLYRAIRTTPETGKTAPGHYGYIPAGQAIEAHQPYTSYSSDIEKAMTFVGNGQIANAKIIEVDVPKSAIVGIQNANYTGKPGEGEFIVRTSDIPGGSRYVTFTGLSTKRKNSDDPLLKFLGKPGPESKGMLLTDIARRYTQMPSPEASSRVPGFWDESQRQYAETRAGNFNFGPRYNPQHQLEFFGITPEEVQIARQHLEEKYGMQVKELAKQKNKKIIGKNYEDQTLLRLASDKEFIPAEAPGTMSTIWSPNYINRAKGGGVGQFHHNRFYKYHDRKFKYEDGGIAKFSGIGGRSGFVGGGAYKIFDIYKKYALDRSSSFRSQIKTLFNTDESYGKMQKQVHQGLIDLGYSEEVIKKRKASSPTGSHSLVRSLPIAQSWIENQWPAIAKKIKINKSTPEYIKLHSAKETIPTLGGINNLTAAIKTEAINNNNPNTVSNAIWQTIMEEKDLALQKKWLKIYQEKFVADRMISDKELQDTLSLLKKARYDTGNGIYPEGRVKHFYGKDSVDLDSAILELTHRNENKIPIENVWDLAHKQDTSFSNRSIESIKEKEKLFDYLMENYDTEIQYGKPRAIGGPIKLADGGIPAMVSNGEYFFGPDVVKHYGKGFMDNLNAGKFAEGGKIVGPGGPKDDVIPMTLPEHSYIINAAATQKIGTPTLDMISSKKFSKGGILGFSTGDEVTAEITRIKTENAEKALAARAKAETEHVADQDALKALKQERANAKAQLEIARNVNRTMQQDATASKADRAAAAAAEREANAAMKATSKERIREQQKKVAASEATFTAAHENFMAQTAGMPMGMVDPNAPKEKTPLGQRIKERYRPAPGKERMAFKSGMGSMMAGTALQMAGSMGAGALESSNGGPTMMSSALGAAGTGAMMGSMLGPEGMIAGALGGAAIGVLMQKQQEDAKKTADAVNEIANAHQKYRDSLSVSSDNLAAFGLKAKTVTDLNFSNVVGQADNFKEQVNALADAMSNGSDESKNLIQYLKNSQSKDIATALKDQYLGILESGGNKQQATMQLSAAAKAGGISGFQTSSVLNNLSGIMKKYGGKGQLSTAAGSFIEQLSGAKKLGYSQADANLNASESNRINAENSDVKRNVSGMLGLNSKSSDLQVGLTSWATGSWLPGMINNINAGRGLGGLFDIKGSRQFAGIGESGVDPRTKTNWIKDLNLRSADSNFNINNLVTKRGDLLKTVTDKNMSGKDVFSSNDQDLIAAAKAAGLTVNSTIDEVVKGFGKLNGQLAELQGNTDLQKNIQTWSEVNQDFKAEFVEPFKKAMGTLSPQEFQQSVGSMMNSVKNAGGSIKDLTDQIAHDMGPEFERLAPQFDNSTTGAKNFLVALQEVHNLMASGLQFNSANAASSAAAAIAANPALAAAAQNQAAFETQATGIGNKELGNINGSNRVSSLETASQKSAEKYAATQKAAQKAYQKEQQQIQDSIKSKGKYIDSIRKEMDARQKLFDKKQQGIQQEQTLQGLQNNIYEARAHGSLLDQAAAQSAYNAELNKQADIKAKQTADDKDQNKIDKANATVQTLQDQLDALSRSYDAVQQSAQDTQDANQASYKQQIKDAKALGDTTSAQQAAWSEGWKQLVTLAEQGKTTSSEEVTTLIDGLTKSSGVAKTQVLKDFGQLQTDFNKTIGSNGLVFNANGTITKLGIPDGTININDDGTLRWDASGKKPTFIDVGSANVSVSASETYGSAQNPWHGQTPTSASLASGGHIQGPGTSTSDSIPARLSDGEYVVRANAVDHYGVSMMNAINSRKFSTGGEVGGPQPPGGSSTKPQDSAYSKEIGSIRSYSNTLSAALAEIAHPIKNWAGLCQSLARTLVGAAAFGGSAFEAWSNTPDKHKHRVGPPPAGAIAYYGTKYPGHAVWVEGKDKKGVTYVVSSPYPGVIGDGKVGTAPWNAFGSYQGWIDWTPSGSLPINTNDSKGLINPNVTSGNSYAGKSIPKIKLGYSMPFADGGKVQGPGTGTSDSIPAKLSNGEYVVKANSVNHYGSGFLDAVNAKQYREGGEVVGSTTTYGPVYVPSYDPWPTRNNNSSNRNSNSSNRNNNSNNSSHSSSSARSSNSTNNNPYHGQGGGSNDSIGPVTTKQKNLIDLLLTGGFRDQGLRMAWSIAMRESGGNPAAKAPKNRSTYPNGTYDAGLFQLNSSNYKGWNIDMKKLFDGAYQAKFVEGFTKNMTKNLLPWGLNPDGSTNAAYYGGWSKDAINNNITKPFRKYYDSFPDVYKSHFNKDWSGSSSGATAPNTSSSSSSASSSSAPKSSSASSSSVSVKPVKTDLHMSVAFQDAADLKNVAVVDTDKISGDAPWYIRMANEAKSYVGKVDHSGTSDSNVIHRRKGKSHLTSAKPGSKNTYDYKKWKHVHTNKNGTKVYVDGEGGWSDSEFTFRMLEKYKKMNGYSGIEEQMNMGKAVAKGKERPGDLIFFHLGNSTDKTKNDPNHVGMYVGNNKIVTPMNKSGNTVLSGMLSGYIKARRFAPGGPVVGPGGPKDDLIPALISNGEYVIRADSVTSKTKPLLDMINAGKFNPKFTSPASRLSTPVGIADATSGSTTNNVEYNLSVTVEKTNASPEDIANVVIQTLKRKEKTNRTHRNL